MPVFVNTFGGSPISPADVAFAAYSFGTNLTLYWPQFAAGQTDVAARFMNLTSTAANLNVYMPDATLVSTGYDVVIFNKGSNTLNVVSYTGAAIATIAPGQTYYLLVIDNTTQSGSWQTVQFGVGTGSASAAALAGAGLIATAGLLNVNFDATTVSTSYTITMAARAILQVWTGGSGTITLPAASSVGDGFFFPLANNGSGNLTVAATGPDTIDGQPTSIFSQTQSGFVISSGSNWYTVGKGIQNNFSVTLLNLNVAGNTDVTETSAQAENIIQQFTGALTGNINVIVPNTVQLYYIFNDTTGAFSLTVKTPAGTGQTVAQGTHTILYCDGTNIVNGYTASVSSTVSVSAGSANAPNINFVGNANTGIYSPNINQIAFTAGGFEALNATSAASSVNYLQVSATATGNAPIISAQGSDGNIGILLSPKGSGAVGIPLGVIQGGLIDNTIIGATTAAAITGTIITANTNFVGPLTGNVTGNVSGNAGTVSTISGLITPGANVTITGSGTSGSPYVIGSTPGSVVTSVTGTANRITSTGGATPVIDISAAYVGQVSITTLGVITTGTWNGTVIGNAFGGAGTVNGLLKANGSGLVSQAISGTDYQAAGNYITALTGDGSASGPGSSALTLATVNSNVGSFTSANITVNAKGLITAASSGSPGNYIPISVTTASNQAAINITSGFNSTLYIGYRFVLSNMRPATNLDTLSYKLSSNGGSTYVGSANQAAVTLTGAANTPTSNPGALGTNYPNSGTINNCTVLEIYQRDVTANPISTFNTGMATGSGWNTITGTDQGNIGAALNAVQFIFGLANITSGTVDMYGILKG